MDFKIYSNSSVYNSLNIVVIKGKIVTGEKINIFSAWKKREFAHENICYDWQYLRKFCLSLSSLVNDN